MVRHGRPSTFRKGAFKMSFREFLCRTWVRHENRGQSQAVSRRRSLALEVLEDRTVPSTVPVLGNLSTAQALGNLSAITNALKAATATPAAGTTSPALNSVASTTSGVASALQNLVTDLTKTLQSVITDLTDTIKLVGDTANSA